MVVTELRATPIAPANTPWRRRIAMASAREVDVPNRAQDMALPNSEITRIRRRPYLSAKVDHSRDVMN